MKLWKLTRTSSQYCFGGYLLNTASEDIFSILLRRTSQYCFGGHLLIWTILFRRYPQKLLGFWEGLVTIAVAICMLLYVQKAYLLQQSQSLWESHPVPAQTLQAYKKLQKGEPPSCIALRTRYAWVGYMYEYVYVYICVRVYMCTCRRRRTYVRSLV